MSLTPEMKRIIKRRTIFAVLLILAAALQNTPNLLPEPWGLRQMGVLCMVVCIAMSEKELCGMFMGLLAGLTLDITGGVQGINAIMLTIIGYFCGLLVQSLIRNNIITSFLFSGVSLLLYTLVYALIVTVFSGVAGFSQVYLKFYLPSIVYTIIFVPVWFYLTKFIFKLLPNDPRRRI